MKWCFFALGVILLVAAIITFCTHKDDRNTFGKRMHIAMVMTGARDDHSWNESHYEAMKKVAHKLNLEVDYYENIPNDSTAENIMEQAIDRGAQVVIATSFDFGDKVLKMAMRHPDIKFLHATGTRTAPNLSTYFGRIYQMRYLSGIVAGLMTKNNRIGFLAGLNISEVNRSINAFALGVQKVNPEAKVYVSWSGSWIDELMADDATSYLIDTVGVDLLTVHVDALAPYEIAEKKNVWIIGYNNDNSKLYPKRFLTAPIWRWENFYEAKILEIIHHKFISRDYWLGVESGVIDLAPLTEHVDDSIRVLVEQERKRIEQGIFDVFFGPIIDNHGVVRIESGESMTDAEMLNHFDWYVKGVIDGIDSQGY